MLPTGYRDGPYISPCNTKQKTPTKTKPNKKASSKTPRHSNIRQVEKSPAGPQTERAPVVCSAQRQPETGLVAQPKAPKHF